MTNPAPRVMLVDDDSGRASHVQDCLQRAGYATVHVQGSHARLVREIERHAPDIIVIEVDLPARDLLESLSVVNAFNPTPIVMFTQEDDPDFIARAVECGVTAYVVDGVNAGTVKPIIDVAMAQFRVFQSLRTQLQATQAELDERQTLDRAKVLLMQHHRCTEQEAYARMRRHAMDHHVRLVDVARRIVAAGGRAGGRTGAPS